MDPRSGGQPGPPLTEVVLSMATFVPGEMGGSETYARGLTRELAHRTDLDLRVLVPAAASHSFTGVRQIALPTLRGGGSTGRRLATMARTANPWFVGRRLLAGADVVHYPFTVPLPLRPRGSRVVTTLHDVQHHDLPHLFSSSERWYRNLAYDRPAQRADLVITVSEFCKSRIMATLDIDSDRITVAHLGVDTDLFQPYRGPRELFVLYPARVWPHKNHARLIEAMGVVRETHPEMRLVLTGGGSANLGPTPNWVEHRGLVSDDELHALYRSAACLAFPSLYEGFGLPVLEAMASGCPVASSDRGSLPEVCGDAAVLFDPEDVKAMAEALHTAIEAHEGLAPRGERRARSFTWQMCAEVHAEAYRGLRRG